LLDELTPAQVSVLMAYEHMHPWGEDREDRRQAIMTAAICSSMSLSGQTIDPNDLLKMLKPTTGKKKSESKVVSPEAGAAIFRQQYMPRGE